jgi:hypothetical protein
MGIWQKITSWWGKDEVEQVGEAARDDSQAELDAAQEDFQGRIDDTYASRDVLGGGFADYERDSRRPSDPAR